MIHVEKGVHIETVAVCTGTLRSSFSIVARDVDASCRSGAGWSVVASGEEGGGGTLALSLTHMGLLG